MFRRTPLAGIRCCAPIGARLARPLSHLQTLILCLALVASACAQGTGSQESFTISGTVVNSATGEPIAHALVRTSGSAQRTAFSDNEGHFQIDGVPQGQVSVQAQKPGFFSDQDSIGASATWTTAGPDSSSLSVKLVPQGAIYGKITDSSGQPIERMPVRLISHAVREGRRHWEPRGMAETDEDGQYRFAGLMPGTYYLSVGPHDDDFELRGGNEKDKFGYPHLYYPGVPELAAAPSIPLSAGQQAQADMSIGVVPEYKVTGTIAGYRPDQGVGLQMFTTAGDEITLRSNFNAETGVFTLDYVPVGNYLLRALSQWGTQALRAEAKINVSSDVNGVHLTLAPPGYIPVNVSLDSRSSSRATPKPQKPPLFVHLIPAGIAMSESFSTNEQGRGLSLQNVDPGTYTVQIRPNSPWYVQSAVYGDVNVLEEDISVAAGETSPLEIVLRDDGGTVAGTLKPSDHVVAPATVVMVRQPLSNQAPQIRRGVTNSFEFSGIAPGDYLVFAFDRAENLDFSSQEVVERYASQAQHIVLTSNQKSQVQLSLIHLGGEE